MIGGFCVTIARRSRTDNLASINRFVSEVAGSTDPVEHVLRRICDGEALPGFDPGLHPQGDPRAKAIFARVRKAYAGDVEHRRLERALAAALDIQGLRPNLALATPHTLFNVGRAAGAR